MRGTCYGTAKEKRAPNAGGISTSSGQISRRGARLTAPLHFNSFCRSARGMKKATPFERIIRRPSRASLADPGARGCVFVFKASRSPLRGLSVWALWWRFPHFFHRWELDFEISFEALTKNNQFFHINFREMCRITWPVDCVFTHQTCHYVSSVSHQLGLNIHKYNIKSSICSNGYFSLRERIS